MFFTVYASNRSACKDPVWSVGGPYGTIVRGMLCCFAAGLASTVRHHRNGGLQIRVMPKCWFVLLRFWLRVDDTILKIRETRYYCEEGATGTVWRETKHVEGTFEELAKGGAPSTNVCFGMPVPCASLISM